MPVKPKRIAIVGGGPTAVYTVKNLLQKAELFDITLFEAGMVAGCGIPYSEEHNSPEMMANITSIEIPPVLTSVADWVRSADAGLLRRFGIDRAAVGDRDFYPRILIGAYYTEQLRQLLAAGEAAGHVLRIETQTRVLDIDPARSGFTVFIERAQGKARRRFDGVIMATGHRTDFEKPTRQGRLYRSPYPVQALRLGDDRAALVLGSSLSGIDAVVALASRYGRFAGEGDSLVYTPKASAPLRLVMASRKGIIPDADFFYPIPEEPLLIFTSARLLALQKHGKTGFLSRAMALFKRQLVADDPGFLEQLRIARFTPEAFARGYFAFRQSRHGMGAVADNLRESVQNYRDRRIVMWRYTLMRAHEVFSQIVPFLDRGDLKRFRRHLVPVFADAYGCVPHLSIRRLLALHKAGCLEVAALGTDGTIQFGAGVFRLQIAGKEQSFQTFIDARGQETASLRELGFARLDQAVEAKDFLRRSDADSDDDQFRIPLGQRHSADIFCISIPVMMQRYPFSQGLVACSEAAEVVAEAL